MKKITERFFVGKNYETRLVIDSEIIHKFAELSGDYNPIHLQADEAKTYGYPREVAHGAILAAVLSKVIGMEIPGPGALWLSQNIEWLKPVYLRDEITLTVTIDQISEGAQLLTLDVKAQNQKGQIVMIGKSSVKVGEKIAANQSKKKNKKTALITGASRGIGAAIAKRFMQEGWDVALHYHNSKEPAEKIAAEFPSVKSQTFQADLMNQDELSRMLDQVNKSFDGIDIVVHGASPMFKINKVTDVDFSEYLRFFQVYVGGASLLLSKLSPYMIDQKFGRFIFLGTSAMLGMPPVGMAPYICAKEALWGLVKSAATELGCHGITANMISPGMTITDLTADIPARVKEVEARKSPARRLATIEDTANSAVFLAHDNASYINGINIPLTGGPV